MQRVDEDQDGLAKYIPQTPKRKPRKGDDTHGGPKGRTTVRGLYNSSTTPGTRHSFLGKYGVGKPTGAQTDASSYWFKHLGFLEKMREQPEREAPSPSPHQNQQAHHAIKPQHQHQHHQHQHQHHHRGEAQSSYVSLVQAPGQHRRSSRRSSRVPGAASPAGSGSGSGGSGKKRVVHAHMCEEAEAMLMRSLIEAGLSIKSRSEEGSVHTARTCSSHKGSSCVRSAAGAGVGASGSQEGDSWSYASSFSSYSLVAGSECGGSECSSMAKGGSAAAAEGRRGDALGAYIKVLLMSDDESSVC